MRPNPKVNKKSTIFAVFHCGGFLKKARAFITVKGIMNICEIPADFSARPSIVC